MLDLLRMPAWSSAAQRGARDLDAEFECLVELHYRRVYSLLYRMVRNECDAADLTQETFLRIYRALPRLRHDGATSAWIHRIAVNVCVDFMRRKRRAGYVVCLETDLGPREEPMDLRAWQEASVDPAEVAERHDRTRQIESAIADLPQAYRTVIRLHHLEGMRVAEIARNLGVPEGTVKSRLSRARAALHRLLAPRLAIE